MPGKHPLLSVGVQGWVVFFSVMAKTCFEAGVRGNWRPDFRFKFSEISSRAGASSTLPVLPRDSTQTVLPKR